MKAAGLGPLVPPEALRCRYCFSDLQFSCILGSVFKHLHVSSKGMKGGGVVSEVFSIPHAVLDLHQRVRDLFMSLRISPMSS